MASAWRIFWLLVLGFHAAAALGWLWLAPGGFPLDHPRFWSNRVAPPIVLRAVAAAVLAARRDRPRTLLTALVGFPALWIAAGVSAGLAFPVTIGPRLGIATSSIGLLMAATLAPMFRRREPGATVGPILVSAAAAAFGALFPLAFRPPAADTRPIEACVTLEIETAGSVDGAIDERAFVHVGDGTATIRADRLRLMVQPMLTFLSRSPDGVPTVLVPRDVQEGSPLRLVGALRRDRGLDLSYRSDYAASLRVDRDDDGAVRFEAFASLAGPIWSHLNSYADVQITGHRRLSFEFSPCPGALVEVHPMDYPTGRPLRFAFLDHDSRFRVVEATSGEKGPFRDLAAGSLRRGEPLAITIHDEARPVARITLEDWSAQVGTSLSPTAGWGAPVNAIEFCLTGDEPTSAAAIYTTLAGTSVGRGWDAVGHRAGCYRNRMKVEVLGPGS